MIFTEIKSVLLSFYSQKSENEALLAFDFKLIDFKSSLMRLCFSPLANWPLFAWAVILYLNPFRYQLQLLGGFSNILAFLYSPQWAMGLSIGMILSYFVGAINIPIALILYFISQGEIHTLLGASLLAGLFMGRVLKYFKLTVKLEGQVKKMGLYYSLMQLLALPIAIAININIYQYMTFAGYFSRTLFAYRFEFIVLSLLVYYAIQFLLNAVWGHFYARKSEDPSSLFVFYSTAKVLRRMAFGSSLAHEMKGQVTVRLNELSHQLEDVSAALVPQHILQVAKIEKHYLELAQKSLADTP